MNYNKYMARISEILVLYFDKKMIFESLCNFKLFTPEASLNYE